MGADGILRTGVHGLRNLELLAAGLTSIFI
jgi:hypothetical protein